jgi:hypothetical protein
MAVAIRVDRIVVNPSGVIDVYYTEGQTPLPAAQSNNAISFTNRLEAVAMKNSFAQSFLQSGLLLKMLLAVYAASANDPNLTSAATGCLERLSPPIRQTQPQR